MSKTFTDDDGNSYELVNPDYPDGVSGMYMIKPIQLEVEKKRGYWLELWNEEHLVLDNEKENLQLTETQAEALAAAIEALVEYVHKEGYPINAHNGEEQYFPRSLSDSIMDARKAMQL